MKCSHSTERERQERSYDKGSLGSSLVSSLVSSQEIKSILAEQRDYLYWTSLAITGDDAIAKQSMVNASDLSASWKRCVSRLGNRMGEPRNRAGSGQSSPRSHL